MRSGVVCIVATGVGLYWFRPVGCLEQLTALGTVSMLDSLAVVAGTGMPDDTGDKALRANWGDRQQIPRLPDSFLTGRGSHELLSSVW